jgi:hypothetical protein
MNEPRKPLKDRSRYLAISPRLARLVSGVALIGMYLSFLLEVLTDDASTTFAMLALLVALAGYGSAIFLAVCTVSFVANAPPRDIDERELQERNAAYFRAYQYAALMLLVGYICSDLLGKVFGGLMMSGELVADYMRVALISSLIMPATVLAWRDRGEEDPG